MTEIDDLHEQSKIVKERLTYHFLKTDGTWDTPKDMPFMKEFLSDVEKLCSMLKEYDNDQHCLCGRKYNIEKHCKVCDNDN